MPLDPRHGVAEDLAACGRQAGSHESHRLPDLPMCLGETLDCLIAAPDHHFGTLHHRLGTLAKGTSTSVRATPFET